MLITETLILIYFAIIIKLKNLKITNIIFDTMNIFIFH